MALSTILIIEDDKQLRDLYFDILKDYAVDKVNDGYKALDKDTKYDLYIVDIGLPGMDGIETIRKLIKNFGNIKTLIIKGNHTAKFSNELKEIQIDGILQKPFKVLDLLEEVEKILDHGSP